MLPLEECSSVKYLLISKITRVWSTTSCLSGGILLVRSAVPKSDL